LKKVKFLALIFLLGILMVGCGHEQPMAGSKVSSAKCDMDWLIGAWRDTGNSDQWEIWKKYSDEYRGKGIAIVGGDTVVFEQMIIHSDGNQLIFTAIVEENDGPVDFVSTTISEHSVIFENVRHDFPKAISYRKLDKIDDEELMETEVRGGEKKIQMILKKRLFVGK
jgi:hypothetical protein